MLLIGSRAIRVHCPEFREPKDWDLIATEQEIERLRTLLEPHGKRRKPDKALFRYGDDLMEVANASRSTYWAMILEKFSHEPKIELPVLGEVAVAPLPYLLLTKQCGLVYAVLHWHKNLEDLFFLMDRVPSIPPDIADLVMHTVAHSAEMFQGKHALSVSVSGACHPELPAPRHAALHAALHERLSRGAPIAPAHAWAGFPELSGEARRARMIRWFAEEALVVGAIEMFSNVEPGASLREAELRYARWGLRTLITRDLPVNWRYFGVNYYREIREQIPDGWSDAVEALRGLLPGVAPCTT